MENTKCPTSRALFSVCVYLSFEKKRKAEYYALNQEFLDSQKIPKERVIFISRYTKAVIIWASEEEILAIKEDSRCGEIHFFCNRRLSSQSEETLRLMRADGVSGTNSQGISGEGQVFGMISAEREIFYSGSPQLKSAIQSGRITVLPYPVPPIPALHPSVVLCEIIGESVTLDAESFRGIANMATAVFSTSETSVDVLRTLEYFISLGIRVVNFSAGFLTSVGYTEFDRFVDILIFETDLLFVTASGNRRSVTSPGIASNSLCVGNLQTNASPNTPASPPFSTYCPNFANCSAFTEKDATTTSHKPDVVAPGTYIPYVTPQSSVYYNNVGTSFACPWVTGIALQLLEEAPSLSAIELKVIIALSSNRRIISTSDNEALEKEPYARERSGFGLVDSSLAIKVLREGKVETLTFSKSTSEDITLLSGETLYLAVGYNKNPETPDASLALRLVSRDFSIVCNRENQNLHVIEYTATRNITLTATLDGALGIKYAKAVYIKRV